MIIKSRPKTFHFVVGLWPAIDYNAKVAPSIDPPLIRCQIKCGIKTSTKSAARHLRVKRIENSFVLAPQALHLRPQLFSCQVLARSMAHSHLTRTAGRLAGAANWKTESFYCLTASPKSKEKLIARNTINHGATHKKKTQTPKSKCADEEKISRRQRRWVWMRKMMLWSPQARGTKS